MQVTFKSTNLQLTPTIKEYAQKKMDKLEKFFGHVKILNADLELKMDSKHHDKGEIYSAELNIELPHQLLRVEKTEKDIIKAIDKVEDHMQMLLKKYKEKRIAKRIRNQDTGIGN